MYAPGGRYLRDNSQSPKKGKGGIMTAVLGAHPVKSSEEETAVKITVAFLAD
jgi:hypothetical protein